MSGHSHGGHSHGGHSHGGHSHGGHSHGGHSHGAVSPGHGVATTEGFVRAERPESSERPELMEGAGKGQLLFLDMPSGIAGDMTIAALLDLGVPLRVVEDAIACLPLDGVGLTLSSGYAGAIGCSHFNVSWPDQSGERDYAEIAKMIVESTLSEPVKQLAGRIFLRLAEAEASVHRTTLDHVHFHEVGAVDAIVDIVGAAAAFCYLGADVAASAVPLGRGFVDCRHGTIPLPAPAALSCLQGVPTVASGLEAELVTPTGAAIVATVASRFVEWPAMTPQRVGWGAGTRGLPDRPNALRAVLGAPPASMRSSSHIVLEANIDDMTGEVAAHALARVLAGGALDAWIIPCTMKKGRPGMVFSALVASDRVAAVTAEILAETSTIGVRQTLVERSTLSRTSHEVSTKWGPVRVKVSFGSGSEKSKPEVEDCIAIAEREGISLREVLSEVSRLL